MLLDIEADSDDFAAAARSQWDNLSSEDRSKLLSLRWRSEARAEPRGSPSSAPNLPRLRGIAAFNGMAVVKLMMKPSSLKTLEALPRNGLAVYLNGSMLNHSCCPTVNRPGVQPRQLQPDDELTCSYIEIRAPHFSRQAELESTWAFERCRCWRCRLEQQLWPAAPEAQRSLRTAWRRFERWRKSGTCIDLRGEELRELVSNIADLTKAALAEFLSRPQEPGQTMGLAMVGCYQDALNNTSDDVKTLDPLDVSKPGTSLAFFRLLLSSFWVGPAFELAFGLQESQRYEEALRHWVEPWQAKRIKETRICAAATEAALSAVAAGLPWEDLLQEPVAICCGTYGEGSWMRLAAGRLERFENSTRLLDVATAWVGCTETVCKS
eukprot:Skav211814  [mRNA]  locus=scaffold305:519714:524266:- [translate_table: standard]